MQHNFHFSPTEWLRTSHVLNSYFFTPKAVPVFLQPTLTCCKVILFFPAACSVPRFVTAQRAVSRNPGRPTTKLSASTLTFFTLWACFSPNSRVLLFHYRNPQKIMWIWIIDTFYRWDVDYMWILAGSWMSKSWWNMILGLLWSHSRKNPH